MGFLRNLLALALALGMATVGVVFALQNSDPVPLDVLIVKLPPRSLALWVLGALALGGILGLALSSLVVLRLRGRLIAARRQIAKAHSELERLRGIGQGSARMGSAKSRSATRAGVGKA